MGEALIIQKREGFSANIIVEYPSGTCTCTNGSVIYTHTGGGTYTFTVNKKGTWTVTIEHGTKNIVKTQTVEITEKGQSAAVQLDYNYVVFANGAWRNAQMTNMSVNGGQAVLTASSSSSSEAQSFSTIKIDLTQYSTAKFVVNYNNGCNANRIYRRFVIGVGNYNTSQRNGMTIFPASTFSHYYLHKCETTGSYTYSGTVTLDISSFNGSYYFGTSVDAYDGTATLKFSSIILYP